MGDKSHLKGGMKLKRQVYFICFSKQGTSSSVKKVSILLTNLCLGKHKIISVYRPLVGFLIGNYIQIKISYVTVMILARFSE